MSSYTLGKPTFKYAKQDINVYKVVKMTDDEDVFKSWLNDFIYVMDKTYKDVFDADIIKFIDDDEIFNRVYQLDPYLYNVPITNISEINIVKKWFHSYPDILDCFKYFNLNNFPGDIRYALPDPEILRIIKCVIPEGSKYYETFENVRDCLSNVGTKIFVSETIKIEEVLNYDEYIEHKIAI